MGRRQKDTSHHRVNAQILFHSYNTPFHFLKKTILKPLWYRLKDQNLKSLHSDLRHSNVKTYELAPKRHADIQGPGRLYYIGISMLVMEVGDIMLMTHPLCFRLINLSKPFTKIKFWSATFCDIAIRQLKTDHFLEILKHSWLFLICD